MYTYLEALNNEPLTKSDIINGTFQFLVKQGGPAKNGPDCVYRAENGYKCALGCWIRDNEYDPSMEGKDITCLIDTQQLPARLIEHAQLLKCVQQVHDNYEGRNGEWRTYLVGAFVALAAAFSTPDYTVYLNTYAV